MGMKFFEKTDGLETRKDTRRELKTLAILEGDKFFSSGFDPGQLTDDDVEFFDKFRGGKTNIKEVRDRLGLDADILGEQLIYPERDDRGGQFEQPSYIKLNQSQRDLLQYVLRKLEEQL